MQAADREECTGEVVSPGWSGGGRQRPPQCSEDECQLASKTGGFPDVLFKIKELPRRTRLV